MLIVLLEQCKHLNIFIPRLFLKKKFKEALIENSCINNEFLQFMIQLKQVSEFKSRKSNDEQQHSEEAVINLIYPHGCTIGINSQEKGIIVPLLSSQDLCFPMKQIIGALYSHNNDKGGIVVVLGCHQLFHDSYISKEDNMTLLMALTEYLTTPNQKRIKLQKLSKIGDKNVETLPNEKKRNVSDIESLSNRIQCCLQEPEDLPDFENLFHLKQFSFQNHKLPDVIKLYKQLHIKCEPLSLIPPQFETPLPPLKPAVFPPTFLEPPPPALELFDIDEELSSPLIKLNQFYHKCCDEKDLQMYIQGCADILELDSRLEELDLHSKRDIALSTDKRCKKILEIVFHDLLKWKQVAGPNTGEKDNTCINEI
ncbi:hypothetical protein RFI_29734 [Reticulomyxa filosa]|uniref:Uncharacterized protein n=1 Tax=Reticulomyxa filosa TaxID=46433 RepID=X6M0E5_RETFI|nr:hypothetical protein RFI_29734 [Reticulomyxa filosa]|eukprot:ETO07658.1 hypothetical protein RFI_29734 [Reticulomyxa filosa]